MRILLNLSLLAILMLNALVFSAQCLDSADIQYNQTSHTVFYSPLFTLQEGETVLTYEWDLGDGNYSSIQFPVHTYDSPDVYEVCLTLTTTAGQQICTLDVCTTISIVESLPCNVTAAFEWVDVGLGEVVLQSFCETNFFTQISDYYWEGSEGQLAQGAQSELVFDDLNNSEVCLTVQAFSQGNTCSSAVCKEIQLETPVLNLIPEFVLKENDGCEMYVINITDAPGIEGVVYSWTLDGSDIPYSQQSLIQFPENGAHSICLNAEIPWYGEIRNETQCAEVISNCEDEPETTPEFDEDALVDAGNPILVTGSNVSLLSVKGEGLGSAQHFSVYNLQGQTVFTGVLFDTRQVDLSALGRGVFVFCIHSELADVVQKIVLP